ncbi:FliC/FljB family flagellin [Enterobacter kobei]|uniref:FliC/FljB family flagellin n=1 Tax=Enterobacter kobei TaxID=208224 RepID=UPI002004794D|nr:FliC/FljB family flagellin [Enterobacter kobei]ELE6493466.1 FliC/FljB family flagellin [Enterobacter kobei]MCK7099173.1 FliC/FljB family flagellin [Enterobacter kobei]HED6942316.1 FliC/FljB family flagellin [Enterobacter kobei]
MAQVINTNSLSLITQNNINKNQSALSSSIERLSSGLRINSAKDDAAGQAIANRFTSNIKGLTQAARNANDGISLAQTTEGALSEINNNLQRVRELTVQASTGTNSKTDLSSIQDEIQSRLDEIDRVSGQTQFNGVNVLAKDGSMQIQVGANDGQNITIDLKKITASTLGLTGFDATKLATTVSNGTKLNATVDFASATVNNTGPNSVTADSLVQDDAGNYFVKGDDDKYYAATVNYAANSISFNDTAASTVSGSVSSVAAATDTVNAKVAVDTTTLGTNESLVSYKDASGNNAYAVYDSSANTFTSATIDSTGKVTAASAVNTALSDLNLDPLDKLDSAISDVDKFRSSLGAVQNRLSSAVTNLNNTTTNLSEAQSRIQDADYATEVSNMSKAQIVQQAGNSVLSKANQVPQQVLSLLQG